MDIYKKGDRIWHNRYGECTVIIESPLTVWSDSKGDMIVSCKDDIELLKERVIHISGMFSANELNEFIHHQWGFRSRISKMLVDECYKLLNGDEQCN